MTKKFAVYALASFFLNFFWEIWHAAYLYKGWNLPARDYILPLTDAALIDTLMLSGILLVGMLIWRRKEWFLKMSRIKYGYFIGTTFVVAVFVEWKGIYWLDKWQYTEMMPTIFGLGLSPLIQLPLTGLVALWLARMMKN